jgi:predicted PurR-regulated permease PerM
MMDSPAVRWMLGLCTAILVAAALSVSQAVLAPVAFAIFTIALVWPVQVTLQARLPKLVALLVTTAVALSALVVLGLVIAWAFGSVGTWVVANAANLQGLYAQKIVWLEARGVPVAGVLGTLDPRWMVRVAQAVLGQLQGLLTFILLTLVFVALGLAEVDVTRRQLARLGDGVPAALLRAAGRSAEKFRTYMMVRTIMSLLTGVVVWAFARAIGLDLAAEWGAIALVLNYIPFIGPLIATLFPTAFAILQFGEWQAAVTVFVVLQVVQSVGGSAIEPWLTGARLAVSPFMVLVAVFLGSLVWGIQGAFIGVPVLIATLVVCEEFPASRWVAELLSGRDGPLPR